MEGGTALNWLDIAILCVLVIGMVNGLAKGLIVSVFNIVEVFAALIGAKYLNGPAVNFIISNTNLYNSIKAALDKKLASMGAAVFSLSKLLNLKEQLNSETLAVLLINTICFIILFCLIIILLNVIKRVLKITISHTPLKYLDRLGGMVIGLITASIFIFIFFAAVTPLTGILTPDKGLSLAIGTSKFARYFYLYNFVVPWLQKMYPVI